MTTDLEGRLREALHQDAQRARLVNPDRPAAPDIVSMSESPRRASAARRLVALAAAITLIAAAAVVVVQTAGHRPTHVTVTPSTVTTAPSSSNKDCPLTPEDVSNAIGEAVFGPASLSACEFSGVRGGAFPNVGFGYKSASACTQARLREFGPAEPVDGLGVDAYAQRVSLGVMLTVCNGDQPFTVLVDGSSSPALPAAIALAKLVLQRLT